MVYRCDLHCSRNGAVGFCLLPFVPFPGLLIEDASGFNQMKVLEVVWNQEEQVFKLTI